MAGATGSGPIFGPCSAYADWDDVLSCGCGGPTVDDEDERALWLSLATEVVWMATGGRYSGQCVRLFNPCRPACVAASHCSCGGVAKARLDLGTVPVWGAFVTIDGEDIEVSIEDWRWLVREDGLPWPVCTADWFVEVTSGWPIPTSITMVTARLACEYSKQCAGLDCALPPATTSYTREGLTVQIADPQAVIDAGRTGIEFVDRILAMHKRGGSLVDLADRGLGPSTTWP